jgi:MPBQ/MSBQ methyltransferase
MDPALEREVESHYRRPELLDAIHDGLRAAGTDLDALKPEDLAAVDEFHTGGRSGTLAALAHLPRRAGMRVLDAGCGLGGTARYLASERDCDVTGIDLTAEYVETARRLTEQLRLGHRCTFHKGSVLAMPVADASFDAAVTIHTAMNVANRERFYTELARTLRPGATLVSFDVAKGPTAGMRYPVPWAESEATSHLRTRAETREHLDAAGFDMTHEAPMRRFAIEFFRDMLARNAAADAPPPLGLHLLMGPNAALKLQNYLTALERHEVEPAIQVARRR